MVLKTSPEETKKRKKKLRAEEDARLKAKFGEGLKPEFGVTGGKIGPEPRRLETAPSDKPLVGGRGRIDSPEVPERGEQAEIFRDPQGNIVGIKEGERFLMGFEQEEAARFLQRGQEKRGAIPIEAPLAAEQRGITAQQEALRGEEPVRRQLDPTRIEGEETAVIGPLGALIAKQIFKTQADILRTLDIAGTGDIKSKEEINEILTAIRPEELKTLALTEIEKNEIEKGLTQSEKFGEFVEALNLGGLSSWAAEKPSENVQTILRELRTEKTIATNAEIKVKDGTWRRAYGEEVIRTSEQNIQRMESRIKLLVQNSPELKFNSDGVNFIENRILEARQRLFAAKINIASGPAQDPSELQILIALQDSINIEDFEIP